MKHIIIYITAALLWCTVSVQAQRRDFPALQVTLHDGTKDTLFIGTGGILKMYGLNNATGDDFMTTASDLKFEYGSFYFENNWTLRTPYKFTKYAYEAGWDSFSGWDEGYGIIVSDNPIDDDMSIDAVGKDYLARDCSQGGCLFMNNGKESWFYLGYGNVFEFYDSIGNHTYRLPLKCGSDYHWRCFFRLDGNTHLGEEKTVHYPKLMEYFIVQESIWQMVENRVVFNNEGDVRAKLKARYGQWHVCLDSLNRQRFKDYRQSLTEEQIAAAAVRTEVCDDGTLYFLDMPDSEVEKMIADFEAENAIPFYVQGNHETTVFLQTKTTKIVTCDEKWGVRDNQYITSDSLNTVLSKPNVYVKLDHMLLPGKTYNITVTIAPQTDETKEVKPLYMRLDILGRDYDDEVFLSTITSHKDAVRLNVPGANLRDNIIAEGDKLTAITVQYTPTQFVYYNAFAISHTKSFFSSNRDKYEQHIRLVGVEIVPAEPASPEE